MSRILVGSVFAWALGASVAYAQSDQAVLPDIVVTATRIPTEVERLPARVTVIERQEIEERGYRTLPDALRAVPGMTVVPTGPTGSQTSVFVRGTESDHVLVLLDGMPINDPSSTGGQFNFGDDLLRDLQRIEIVRGPTATLYGSAAIGGVVNLITQRGGKKPFEPYAEIAGGNRSTFQGVAGARGTVGRFDYGFSLEGLTTNGFNATPQRLPRNLTERDGADIWTATANGAVAVTDKVRLNGLLRYRENELELDSVPLDDPNYEGKNRQLTWKTGAEALWLNDRLTTTLDIGQNRTHRTFEDRADRNSVTVSDDKFKSVRDFARLENRISLPDLPGVTKPAIVLGAEYLRDRVEVDSSSDIGFGPFTQAVDEKADSYAFYLSGQATFFDRLTVTAGVRHEEPDDFESTQTYRFGSVLDIPEIKSRLLGAVGTSFKAPTLFDRFGVNNFGYVGNPDLDPERAFSYEAGFDTTLPILGRRDGISFGATYFNVKTKDLIENDFVLNTVVNVARAKSEGVEAFVTFRPAAWLDATVTYTYTEAKNRDTGDPLLRRPRHQGSITAAIRPIPKLSILPEAIFVGRREDVRYGDNGAFLGAGREKSYTLLNLSANYAVTDQITTFVRMRNLLDHEYEPANGFRAPGFSALTGVRVQF